MAVTPVIEIDTSQIDEAVKKIEHLTKLVETFLTLCEKSTVLMFLFGIKKEK
jgi:hypothetical protein